MKKTALTIGLFSLAVVATSVATPEIQTNVAVQDTILKTPIDGGATGGVRKKPDNFAMNTKLSKNVNFASVNQSVGNDKKVD